MGRETKKAPAGQGTENTKQDQLDTGPSPSRARSGVRLRVRDDPHSAAGAAVASAVSVATAELGAAFLIARRADHPTVRAVGLPASRSRNDVVQLRGLVHHTAAQWARLADGG